MYGYIILSVAYEHFVLVILDEVVDIVFKFFTVFTRSISS